MHAACNRAGGSPSKWRDRSDVHPSGYVLRAACHARSENPFRKKPTLSVSRAGHELAIRCLVSETRLFINRGLKAACTCTYVRTRRACAANMTTPAHARIEPSRSIDLEWYSVDQCIPSRALHAHRYIGQSVNADRVRTYTSEKRGTHS